MKKALVIIIAIVIFFLLIPVQSLFGINVKLSEGTVSNPFSSEESSFFKALILESFFDKPTGVYKLKGVADAAGYNGDLYGTYDPVTRQLEGQYWYYLPIGDMQNPSERNLFTGTFSGVAGFGSQVTVKLTGTQTYTKYNYEYDESGALLYKDCIEETEDYPHSAEVTFNITGIETETSETLAPEESQSGSAIVKEEAEEDTQEEREDSNLRVHEIMTKSGFLYIKRAGAEKPEMADSDTIIYVGDTILVPKNAAVFLKLNSYEISAIYLRGGTEFEVKSKYKIKTMGDIFEALINLREKIVSFGGTNEEFEIETNRANTSIKGTIVVVKDDGITSSLKVLEGEAEFTDKATGKTVSVKSGEMVEASDTGMDEVQTFDADAEEAIWKAEFKAIEDTSGGLSGTTIIILIITGSILIIIIFVLVFSLKKRKQAKTVIK